MAVRVTEIVLAPAALAFLEVGTFVAVALAGFGLLRWRVGDRLPAWLERHRHRGPAVGALFGAVPGCGGAIVVMPLYLRGQVSFGTVVATLTATMGDSSFVLLAADPSMAVTVHLGLLTVGAITGWLVDAWGIDPRSGRGIGADPVGEPPVVASTSEPVDAAATFALAAGTRRPSTVGAAAAPLGILGRPVVAARHPALWAFWLLTVGAFLVALPVVFQLVDEGALPVAGMGLPLLLGGLGAATALTVTAIRWRTGVGRGACELSPTRPREVLVDAARQTAEVTTWVIAAFVGYEALVTLTGVDIGAIPTLGLLGVVAGAALGLIPGCGPQLVLTGLYAQGALPVSVLAANALSQDGDALFPLLAADRRSAVAAMAITTVPGVAVGAALVGLGL